MKHNETITKQSIYKIAARAKVSPATVSRVLNNKENVRSDTRIRIQNIIERYNFKPRLVKAKTLNIGIVVQSGSELFGNYLNEVTNGIFDYCIEYNYNLLHFSLYEKRVHEQGILNILRENRIDGIILLLSNKDSRYILDAEQEKYPYIVMNNVLPNGETNHIEIDNDEGIRLALQHLFEAGHRNICFLTGDVSSHDHRERLEAYVKYMKQSGLFNERYAADFIRADKYLTSLEQGYRQMKNVIRGQKEITAVLANNDDQAIGAIKAMGENYILVPKDVSIIGFDDYTISSYTNPGLTTIRQPLFDMGRIAVAKLVTLITGVKKEHIRIKIKPELVVRDSVKKINTGVPVFS
ncbi:MAG: LacI family DNA-binding transcriptional regulator [bacterium]|nr:LacI family DNA-binding transcriptional regulator [bacterium]